MATDSVVRSCTNTLSGSTADTVTLTQAWQAIEVTNQHASEWIYLRQDGTTAVAEADNTTPVAPATSKTMTTIVTSSNTVVVSIVGNGNKYTIEGVN